MGPPRFSASPLPAYIEAYMDGAPSAAAAAQALDLQPERPTGRARKQVQRWSEDPLAVADLGGSADKHAAVISPPGSVFNGRILISY